ncbi:MAG TPA: nicotinamide riboside transporter PnuC [Gemmatimonadaceae bacterium]
MTALEAIAALFGVVSVYLGTRQNILIWPTGIVNVGLYFLVFFDARLYADAGLQLVYLALLVYGWWAWLYGGAEHTRLEVARVRPRAMVWLMLLNVVAWLALATTLHRYTNAAIPYLDALLTTTSLVAQWMMTRKLLEAWVVWIAVDAVYVPTFIWRELYPTALLYAIFLVLAVKGYRDWRASMEAGVAVA